MRMTKKVNKDEKWGDCRSSVMNQNNFVETHSFDFYGKAGMQEDDVYEISSEVVAAGEHNTLRPMAIHTCD